MSPDRTADEFVEVYRTDSPEEARRLRDVVLRPEGIEAVLHDRTDHALPAPASQSGEVSIAVPAAQADRAVEILDEFLAAEREAGETGEEGP